MALLSRDDILSADDYEYDVVSCPEWGGDVRVRCMSGAERDEYESGMVKFTGSGKPSVDLRNARVRLVAMCAVDEEGRKLFTLADVKALAKKNARPIDRLAEKIGDLSKVGEDAVEEAAETFDSAQSGS